VEQPAETVGSLHTIRALELVDNQVGDRRSEVDAAVRAFMVVMGYELAPHPVEVVLAANEQPVQAFGPGCPHEAFSERVRPRRPNGRLGNPGTARAPNFVERPDELVITVADQGPDGPALVLEGADQVPGLLGGPGGPTGGAVTPARKTLRRRRSMKNST
jgi:hypothetical protein